MLVTQLCPTLCDPKNSSPPGSSVEFSRQEYWSGLPFCHSLLRGLNLGILNCRHILYCLSLQGSHQTFSGGAMVKNPTVNARNSGNKTLIPGLGRYSRERNDNPLQYSCLGNPMCRGSWGATVQILEDLQMQESNMI